MKGLINSYHGLPWVAILRITIRLLSFFRILILARILLPSQFGTFAVVAIVLSLFETLTEIGTNVFLVQQKSNKEFNDHINVIWSLSVARGIIISAFMVLLAPSIGSYFDSLEIEKLIYFSSVIPLIRGFINPSIAKFQKNLLFDKEFGYKLIIYLVDASVSIIAAIILKDPISLVYGLIASAVMEVILSVSLVKPRPIFDFGVLKIKTVLSQGKWLTLSGIFDYLFQNLDDIFVGKLLGPFYLGIYQIAYKISSLPTTEVSEVVTRVTFPVYKRNMNKKLILMAEFKKFTYFSTFSVLTISILIFILAETLILATLGSDWSEAVVPVRILVVYGAIKSIFYPMMSMFLAFDKQEYITLITFAGVCGMLLAIYPLILTYGVAGAAYSALAGVLTTVPLIMYYLNKLKQS